eukprot:3950041-Prymnesium_polylepis.1
MLAHAARAPRVCAPASYVSGGAPPSPPPPRSLSSCRIGLAACTAAPAVAPAVASAPVEASACCRRQGCTAPRSCTWDFSPSMGSARRLYSDLRRRHALARSPLRASRGRGFLSARTPTLRDREKVVLSVSCVRSAQDGRRCWKHGARIASEVRRFMIVPLICDLLISTVPVSVDEILCNSRKQRTSARRRTDVACALARAAVAPGGLAIGGFGGAGGVLLLGA